MHRNQVPTMGVCPLISIDRPSRPLLFHILFGLCFTESFCYRPNFLFWQCRTSSPCLFLKILLVPQFPPFFFLPCCSTCYWSLFFPRRNGKDIQSEKRVLREPTFFVSPDWPVPRGRSACALFEYIGVQSKRLCWRQVVGLRVVVITTGLILASVFLSLVYRPIIVMRGHVKISDKYYSDHLPCFVFNVVHQLEMKETMAKRSSC